MDLIVISIVAVLLALLVAGVVVLALRRQLDSVRREASADRELAAAVIEEERRATAEALQAERAATADALEHRSTVVLNDAIGQLLDLADQRVSARSEELDLRLKARTEQVGNELVARSTAFDKQVDGLTRGLSEVTSLVERLQRDRAHQHGELVQRLADTARTTSALADTAQGLREALASPKARGQWGERMAEDVLGVAGFVEGINYRRQTATAGGKIPDFTFLLPRGLELNMDVKFPIDNYLRFLDADSDADRDRFRATFARDVRNRVKELVSRDYIDPERTVDYVLLFIPNESVYGFLHENDADLAEIALRQKVVLCSPFTLFAVLGVVRQAVDQFQLERTSNEILQCLGGFSAQWQKFAEQIDRVDRHLSTLNNSVEALNGPRRRMLERELGRIDQLRKDRGLLSDEDDALLLRPALREVSGGEGSAG